MRVCISTFFNVVVLYRIRSGQSQNGTYDTSDRDKPYKDTCDPGDKLKWKALCGHLMPTEYADYVTFVFGYVHVWCCHKFVCLCVKCVVEGQRAVTCKRCNSGLCGFICTTYLIRRVISCGFYVKVFPSLRASEKDCSRLL